MSQVADVRSPHLPTQGGRSEKNVDTRSGRGRARAAAGLVTARTASAASTLYGIDISTSQSGIDLGLAASQGQQFAIVKAGGCQLTEGPYVSPSTPPGGPGPRCRATGRPLLAVRRLPHAHGRRGELLRRPPARLPAGRRRGAGRRSPGRLHAVVERRAGRRLVPAGCADGSAPTCPWFYIGAANLRVAPGPGQSPPAPSCGRPPTAPTTARCKAIRSWAARTRTGRSTSTPRSVRSAGARPWTTTSPAVRRSTWSHRAAAGAAAAPAGCRRRRPSRTACRARCSGAAPRSGCRSSRVTPARSTATPG